MGIPFQAPAPNPDIRARVRVQPRAVHRSAGRCRAARCGGIRRSWCWACSAACATRRSWSHTRPRTSCSAPGAHTRPSASTGSADHRGWLWPYGPRMHARSEHALLHACCSHFYNLKVWQRAMPTFQTLVMAYLGCRQADCRECERADVQSLLKHKPMRSRDLFVYWRRLPLPGLVHHRSLLVNSYPAVSAQQPRLDFSFYEYPDTSRFAEVRSCTPQKDAFYRSCSSATLSCCHQASTVQGCKVSFRARLLGCRRCS